MTIIGTKTNLTMAIYITIIAFFSPWNEALEIKKNGKAGKPSAYILRYIDP